jgi:DNA-binding CsgD family transcriptional regulator
VGNPGHRPVGGADGQGFLECWSHATSRKRSLYRLGWVSGKKVVQRCFNLYFPLMDVPPGDLLLINKLLLELYGAPTAEEHIQAMLRVLAELVPSDLIAWNEFKLTTREIRLVSLPPLTSALTDRLEIIGRYAHQSPFPAYFAASGDRSWRMITDFMPIEDFEQTTFCREGLGPTLGPYQIGTILDQVDDVVNAFTLNRVESNFSERDRGVLNLLFPHLSLSYYNVRAMDRAHRSIRKLQSVVEAAAIGYVFIGQQLEVEWLTAKAKELFQQFYTDEATDSKGVPTPVLAWLRKSLSDNAQAVSVSAVQFRSSPTDSQRLELRLVASQLGGWVLSVVAHEAEPRPRFTEQAELSSRENEVLRWMTEGKRNGEIAVILGISPRTVERHVGAVLERLKVENRASAIVYAMQMAAQKRTTVSQS